MNVVLRRSKEETMGAEADPAGTRPWLTSNLAKFGTFTRFEEAVGVQSARTEEAGGARSATPQDAPVGFARCVRKSLAKVWHLRKADRARTRRRTQLPDLKWLFVDSLLGNGEVGCEFPILQS